MHRGVPAMDSGVRTEALETVTLENRKPQVAVWHQHTVIDRQSSCPASQAAWQDHQIIDT